MKNRITATEQNTKDVFLRIIPLELINSASAKASSDKKYRIFLEKGISVIYT